MPPDGENITALLVGYGRGDKEALDQLMPIVYEELRRQASRYLRREQAGHTLARRLPPGMGFRRSCSTTR